MLSTKMILALNLRATTKMLNVPCRHIFAKERMMKDYSPEKTEKFYHLLHK
jgi:hypothetical protein